ncbi:MAG: hypothetical protein JNM36_10985 [Chitinophagales bacterium]|nr:hypothetical protein [Chitinophagales bacterium]
MWRNRQNAYDFACYHKIKQRPQHAGRIHSKKEHPFLLLFWVSKKAESPFVIYDNSISRNGKLPLIDVAFWGKCVTSSIIKSEKYFQFSILPTCLSILLLCNENSLDYNIQSVKLRTFAALTIFLFYCP